MITVQLISDIGNDVLEVVARDGTGRTYKAHGWVSATTNFYPPGSNDNNGLRSEKAQPRAMVHAELIAYAEQLINDQNPEVVLKDAPRVIYAA